MRNLRSYIPALVVGAPFIALLSVFLVWPTVSVIGNAFFEDGQFTTSSMSRAMTGTYRSSFILSIQLSLVTAFLGGLIGLLMAVLLRKARVDSRTRTFTDAWCAVASQLGGLPLAFAFIALLGTQGLLTKLLKGVGIDIVEQGFSIGKFAGWVLVYLYFQIPLMFLIMTPAISALKDSWFEGATSLGASPSRFWRSVGMPILFPTILTGFILLFVGAFSAYATAYALSSGAGQLVPLQIRFILQGNVITGEDQLGFSLVTWTLILLAFSLVAITLLQRRVSKWTQVS